MTDLNLKLRPTQPVLSECPLCCSIILLLDITEHYDIPSSDEKISVDYGICGSCSFVMQINPMTGEGIRKYYENSPRFRSAELTPTERQLCLNQIAFMLEGSELQNKRVLDIGADMGKLLTILESDYNCATSYQEQSAFALSYLRTHTTHKEIDLLKETDIFDWIVLSEVLEHIINPVTFLKNLKVNLSAEGCLFIEVPNHSFWDDRDYGFSFEHVNYFSVATLISTLDRAGFVVTRLTVTSDKRYFDGKYRIIRIVAVKKNDLTLKDLNKRIRQHNNSLLDDSFKHIEKMAIDGYRSLKRPVGLYAAGELLKLFFERYPNILPESVLIFDSDPKKHGQYVNGILIRSPQEIVVLNPTAIVIMSGAVKDIHDGILRTGYSGKICSFDQTAIV